METNHRIIVMKALVGSRNYNLNTESSDRDYKYFVLPSFDDLYNGMIFSTGRETPLVDYTVHDVRMLESLFWKAHVNFLEVLYSQELIFTHEAGRLQEFLLGNRKELCSMNLPHLFDSSLGMAVHHWRRLLKETPISKDSIERHGYSIKDAYHSIRILSFLDRMIRYDLDFGKAVRYPNGEERDFLMALKSGCLGLAEVEVRYDDLSMLVKKQESFFKEHAPQPLLLEKLKSVIKELIYTKLKDGIISVGVC